MCHGFYYSITIGLCLYFYEVLSLYICDEFSVLLHIDDIFEWSQYTWIFTDVDVYCHHIRSAPICAWFILTYFLWIIVFDKENEKHFLSFIEVMASCRFAVLLTLWGYVFREHLSWPVVSQFSHHTVDWRYYHRL